MLRALRIRAHLRRAARRYPRINFTIRAFIIFSAAFGGAYGFISASRMENSGYNPQAFALGANDDYVVAVPDGRGFRPLGRIHRQGAEEATLHRIRLARPTPPVSRLRIFGLAGDGLYTVGRLRVNPER